MIFCCKPDNDLYRVLVELGFTYPRYETLAETLSCAPQGAGVLALADDYPRPSAPLDESLCQTVIDKELRLYLEYPAALPNGRNVNVRLKLGEPCPTEWERLVVSSDFFAPAADVQHVPLLARHTILAQHGCWFLPLDAASPHLADVHVPLADVHVPLADVHVPLVAARVAGYDSAVYGLPKKAHPILFQLPGHDILVATSKLSQFVRGRYGPQHAWKAIWERLLRWVSPSETPPELSWSPTVRIQAGPDERLDNEAEALAFHRSVRWFREHVVYSIDWKKGAIEGYQSAIDHKGRQMPRTWARGDCTAETGMVFAYDWALTRDPSSRQLATQILDYVWSSDFFQGDPDSPAYGLNNWWERGPVFYGDDNARVILPTLAAGHLLGDDRWDERVLRCLLANLRTTGTLGFRRNRIDLHHLVEAEDGWRSFQREETISYAPHYQAYLWAAYLWAHSLTGHEGFFAKAHNAIRMTMDVYPAWRWTNGLTQEMARMLLPLAFLVRIDDGPAHRGWLQRVARDLLAQMQPNGAIHELLGPLENGRYAPPQSNEAYGTTEASLIQKTGDPASDLLYTVNYAFLGLHEAAAATGDALFEEAADRLAEFLCRIQVRSETHPYLDGAWMRSFDDRLWEYWGSSADAGWGAWSVESGWTNTWIAAVLGMRRLGGSLYDLTASDRMRARFPDLAAEMLAAP